jgi:hypothetical protein
MGNAKSKDNVASGKYERFIDDARAVYFAIPEKKPYSIEVLDYNLNIISTTSFLIKPGYNLTPISANIVLTNMDIDGPGYDYVKIFHIQTAKVYLSPFLTKVGSIMKRVDNNSFFLERNNKTDPWGFFQLDTRGQILWSFSPTVAFHDVCVTGVNTFISVSRDDTIQLWQISSRTPVQKIKIKGVQLNPHPQSKLVHLHNQFVCIYYPMAREAFIVNLQNGFQHIVRVSNAQLQYATTVGSFLILKSVSSFFVVDIITYKVRQIRGQFDGNGERFSEMELLTKTIPPNLIELDTGTVNQIPIVDHMRTISLGDDRMYGDIIGDENGWIVLKNGKKEKECGLYRNLVPIYAQQKMVRYYLSVLRPIQFADVMIVFEN